MLRRLRFGTLSLFAAMLLVVSGAGWWKFHWNLYVEEVDARTALLREGLTVSTERRDGGWIAPPDDEAAIPWYAPLMAPLEHVSVTGTPSKELRDVVLKLPRLKTYGERPSWEALVAQPWMEAVDETEWEDLLGRPLPAFDEPRLEISRLDAPLPSGTPVDDAESDRIAHAIYAAWTNPDATPARSLSVSEGFLGVRLVRLSDGARQFVFQAPGNSQLISCDVDGTSFSYERRGAEWKRTTRISEPDFVLFQKALSNFHGDQFPFHTLAVDRMPFVVRTFEALPRYEIERVEKIDETRYRVDFAPFTAKLDEETQEAGMYQSPPRVERWACVLNSDLQWTPEETLLIQAADGTFDNVDNPVRVERRVAQRLRKEKDYVVLVERNVRTRVLGGAVRELCAVDYATEIDPAFSEKVFDPATLDPEVWPDPRPLPFWRWYRVTFAVSVAIFALLIGRSAIGFFTRFRGSGVQAEAPLSAERRPLGENAEVATPGS